MNKINEENKIESTENSMINKKSNLIGKLNLFLGIAILGILIFNQFQINGVNKSDFTETVVGTLSDTIKLESALKEISPKGIPDVYGSELGISYDEPIKGMTILNQYDDLNGPDGRGTKAIVLNQDKQSRYVKITNMIGCEFCCGAQTITTKTGEPACGCAHSGAMRGLAKYILQNHPEMNDEQILNELVKWKILFFPKDMAQQYLERKGIQINSNNLESQVGGC